MSEPEMRTAYSMSEETGEKLHNASLMLKGMERLLFAGMEDRRLEQMIEVLEIVHQLAEVTATYVKEAIDVAGEISFVLSGAPGGAAHQR